MEVFYVPRAGTEGSLEEDPGEVGSHDHKEAKRMTLDYLIPRHVDLIRMTATYAFYFDDGEEMLVEVGIVFVSCPRCRGRGKHLSHQIVSQLDWENLSVADQLELESGKHDVPCQRCNGERVVIAIDESECGLEMLEQFRDRDQKLKKAAEVIRRISQTK
jgi:hypothetical protein